MICREADRGESHMTSRDYMVRKQEQDETEDYKYSIDPVLLAGLSITLYLVVSDWYISHHQGQVVDNYDKKAAEMSQKRLTMRLRRRGNITGTSR